MKTRSGFVSNSSSSSFIIAGDDGYFALDDIDLPQPIIDPKIAEIFTKDELEIIQSALVNLTDSLRHDGEAHEPDSELYNFRVSIDDLLERFGEYRQM